ncbi:hypothetical protein B0H13DRAFT_1972781 [Mycena leptocephala]|nr:hypothetical protein B0H13DRAFT_1972781 [Mycena leptocephala]
MAPPPGMHCPMCNNFLIPHLTKSGLAPNTYLAQCVNPRHALFNFRFGPEYSLPTPAPALPLPSRVAGELSKATSGQPRHCVGNTTEGHQCKTAPQISSVPNTIAIPPPPLPRQQPADPWHLSFDDILTNVTRPLRLLSEYQAQEEARAAEKGQLLDIAVGMVPDSPELSVEDELMRCIEQDDRAFAFRLSEELNGTNGDLFPPHLLRLRLRALPLSRATAPDATGTNKRPCQRLGAASAVAKRRPTLSFNITAQMNQTWMSQNGSGSTSSSSQTPSPSQATLPPSTVFHVRQGGSCRQFADPHLCYNLKAERTAVRTTLNVIRGNTLLIILDSDSDNDVEVSAVTAAPTSCKRRIKHEDDALPHLPQRPCLAVNTDVVSTGHAPPSTFSTSSTTSSPPSALSLYSPSLSSTSEPLTPLEPSEPATLLEPLAPTLKWPGGMYTVDVVDGILRMDLQELAGMNRSPRFIHIFKRPYKSATYNNNVRRWKSALSELQRRSLAAGRTEDGLRSMFCLQLNAERMRN